MRALSGRLMKYVTAMVEYKVYGNKAPELDRARIMYAKNELVKKEVDIEVSFIRSTDSRAPKFNLYNDRGELI